MTLSLKISMLCYFFIFPIILYGQNQEVTDSLSSSKYKAYYLDTPFDIYRIGLSSMTPILLNDKEAGRFEHIFRQEYSKWRGYVGEVKLLLCKEELGKITYWAVYKKMLVPAGAFIDACKTKYKIKREDRLFIDSLKERIYSLKPAIVPRKAYDALYMVNCPVARCLLAFGNKNIAHVRFYEIRDALAYPIDYYIHYSKRKGVRVNRLYDDLDTKQFSVHGEKIMFTNQEDIVPSEFEAPGYTSPVLYKSFPDWGILSIEEKKQLLDSYVFN